MNATLALLIGLLLRIGLPLALMSALVFFLRRLDERWQREAPAVRLQPGQTPCWEQKGCPLEAMKSCPAPQGNAPCWQARRASDGRLQPACLECSVFRAAPAPAPIPVHIHAAR
ncbi:MAG: hypothetical protein OHK0031_04330 [Anaerolineales bacterium]